jgi:hypothetical protein
MEFDLQNLCGLHVHSCTYMGETPQHPPPPIWANIRGRYWSAKINDISLGPSAFKSFLCYKQFTTPHREAGANLLLHILSL